MCADCHLLSRPNVVAVEHGQLVDVCTADWSLEPGGDVSFLKSCLQDAVDVQRRRLMRGF
jgi:hypothetical protein